jgi:hypothetical protein
MKARTIVGVDVSKLTLDSALLPADQIRQVQTIRKALISGSDGPGNIKKRTARYW